MNQINKLLLCLIFFGVACGKIRQNKPDEVDILKKGAELYAKYGCAVCHSLEGTVVYGPPLNNLYMKEVTVIRRGKEKTVTANREYLKKAIVDPRFEKVLEYKNKEMPLTQISDEDAEILVDYIIEMETKNIPEK